ncbi:hypothetical protein BDN72DRAFT_893194 [Pluteus cervinus]|uniref:Uncharacterized protein n=1 Tax=Pluteus cervinus TaxID=181527 RepID=A0ACD3B7T1_9AGAR|nr:hypothetical protein BDN72DRAFT_893194 [Pluteus cervinus]
MFWRLIPRFENEWMGDFRVIDRIFKFVSYLDNTIVVVYSPNVMWCDKALGVITGTIAALFVLGVSELQRNYRKFTKGGHSYIDDVDRIVNIALTISATRALQ